MQPQRINSLEDLLKINTPAPPTSSPSLTSTPQPFKLRDFGPQVGADEVLKWVGSKAGIDPGIIRQSVSTKVNIHLDPKTHRIKIQAPQYYVDSKEFQEQVLPAFKQLEGKELTDTQFTALVNSDMVKDMQKQADDVRKRFQAVQEYKDQFPKATDDDAMLYLRNAAAANTSDNDEQTQLVTGVNPDGSLQTNSVKEFLNVYKSMDDTEKATRLKTSLDNIDNDKLDEKNKAIQLSLIRFLKEKKVFEASGITKWDLGMQKYISESDTGIPGWIYNQTLGRISSGLDQTQAEEARRKLANDPRTELEGVETALSIGGALGELGGLVSDIAISGPIAGIAAAKGAATASKIPGAARVIQGADAGLDALRTGNAVEKIVAGTVRNIPADISFGAQRTLVEDEYDAAQDFVINTAMNAAMLGGAKAAGATLRSVDTASNRSLSRASEAVGKVGVKALDKVEAIPGLGKAIKFISGGFIDQAAPLRRSLRSAWANNQITTNEYQGYTNLIRWSTMRGRPEANQFIANSPTVRQADQIRQQLKPKELEQAARYVNAVQQLQYAEAGRYEVSQKRLKELRDYVAANKKPEYDAYREALVAMNKEIVDLGTSFGIFDEDIIEAMRADPAFAAGYVRLQKEIEPNEDLLRQTATDRSLKNKQVIRKLSGPAALDEMQDPFAAAAERLYAIHDLRARNELNRIAVRAINEGWVSGRILQSSTDVRARNTLRNAFKEEREIVDDVVDTQMKKLEVDLNKLVDDVEDFNGSGRIIISQRIDEAVEDMVGQIVKSPKLNDEVTRLMDELGGGKEGAERVAALGVLTRNKQRIGDQLERSLLDTNLGREERAEVVRLFESRIDEELDVELALRESGRGPLNARREEIRRLNAEIAPGNELKGDNVQAYYENGAKGYYEIDDPDLAAYYASRKTPSEDKWIQRMLTLSSRVFRAGTTGVNPVFALMVNPIRDLPQAAVVGGVNVLSPAVSHKSLLTSIGMADNEATRLSRELDAFIDNSTSYDVSRQAQTAYTNVEAILQRQRRGKVKNFIINVSDVRHPIDRQLRQLEDALSTVEIATRKRVYKARFDTAVRRGLDPDAAHQEALFYAANATADFLNVGSKIQSFVRTAPYLTAAINGQASFLRLAMLDPIGVAARLASGVVVPVMWLTGHNLIDDDRAATYFSIPEYERANNFIIVLGDGQVVKIPMSQELAGIVNPFRQRIEAHYGLEKDNFLDTVGKFVLGQSPVDLSPLLNRDYTGERDIARGIAQVGSSILPQALRAPVEIALGRDLYTGNDIRPTDAELYASGQVPEGQEITPADRTRAGADSFLLRKLSDLTGQDQAIFQNVIKNYGGSVGGMVLSALDKLAGAPESQTGGKALNEAISSRLFGVSYDQAQSDFYRGLDRLEGEKQILQRRLAGLSTDAYFGNEGAIADRERLINDFGKRITNFVDTYGDFYSRVGGVQPYQLDSIIKLLDFGPEQGTFEQGTYQNDLIQQARNESRSEAVRRATDLGLDTSNDRDRYGRLLTDVAGELYEDTTRTSLANTNINTRIYGTPKQLSYEFGQIIKGDKKKGIRSLYEVQQGYFDRLDKLYEKAVGLKGKEAQDIYSQISDVQEEYMAKEFDPRIRPLIEKYGPQVLMNNKEIFNEIGSRIMVPGDFTPFTSRKKQPYQKDDVEAYLLDRYGVGRINQTNLPTDSQVGDIIGRVNADLSAGRSAAARFKLENLQEDIDSGRVYVDQAAMETIKNLISVANRR